MRAVQIEEVYSEVSNSLKNYVRFMLLINNYAMKIWSELATHDVDLLTNWQNSNEVLYRENKLYLFKAMRMNALARNHDDSLVDHFEVKKTLELFHRKYYWLNSGREDVFFDMKQLVREYCESCVVCKRSKASRHKSYENLQFLFISEFRWTDLTMNFVIEFSASRDWNEAVYDFILVVVNRFTKMTHYVSITKTISAKNLTEIFMREIIKLHDILASMIIDRNTIFTSKFYFTLVYCLKIKHKLSTIFHSQIDDQTKRLNVFMKQYLRIYVNFEQDDWVTLLFMTEFAYNNSINASIDCSSFEVNLSFFSRMSFEEFFDFRVKSVSVKQHAVYLSKLIEMLQKILSHAQIKQKKYADARMKSMKYAIDDHVWLRSKNIRTKRNKKLEWKQFEPFEVLDKINKQIYKLALSTRWRIHNVFHVFLLELAKKEKKVFIHSAKPSYEPDDIEVKQDDENEYFVHELVDFKIFDAGKCFDYFDGEYGLYYRVHWQDYNEGEKTWKSIEHVKHLKDLLKVFHRANLSKSDASEVVQHKRFRRQTNKKRKRD